MFLDFIKISISCALALSVAACASHGLPKIERDSKKRRGSWLKESLS